MLYFPFIDLSCVVSYTITNICCPSCINRREGRINALTWHQSRKYPNRFTPSSFSPCPAPPPLLPITAAVFWFFTLAFSAPSSSP